MDVKEIIRLAGGVAHLARALGVRHPSVSEWKRVPADRVQAVSALSGLPPHMIRPDVFSSPAAEAGVATPEAVA